MQMDQCILSLKGFKELGFFLIQHSCEGLSDFTKWSLIAVHQRDNASSHKATCATVVGFGILHAEGVFKALQRHGEQLFIKDMGKGCICIYKAAIIAQQTTCLQFIFTPINKYDKEKGNVKNPESTKSSAWGRQRHITVLIYHLNTQVSAT